MLRKLVLLGIGGFVIIGGGLTTLLAVLIAFGGEDYGTRLEFNGGELFYTESVQESDANALGEFLIEGEFFDGGHKSVQLDRHDETLLVRFCVIDGAWDDTEAQAVFKPFQPVLSMFVFDGEPVEIHLCNDMMDTQYVISAADENPLAGLTSDTDENS